MKELIVLGAVIVLLLFFPLQYALEQSNHHKLSQLEKVVNNAKEQAKSDGYFTTSNIDTLKANILSVFPKLNESELIIEVTTTPKYRTNTFDDRELIHYRIGVPIKSIIAIPSFWGISDADNRYVHVIENYTTSELNMP